MSTEVIRILGWDLVSASAHSAVLGVLVLGVRSVLRPHLSPDWRLALVGLVVLRLVWPWHIATPVSLFNVTASWMPPLSASSLPLDAWRVVGWVWLAGLSLRVGLVVRDGLRVRRWILHSQAADPRLERIWQAVFVGGPGRLARVPIRQSREVSGPCVAGLIHPRLLLPADLLQRLSESEIRLVMLHEAAHLRRRDPWWNVLIELIHAIHWFNPVVGCILRRWREDREEVCDLHALRSPCVDHLEYGRVLLKCLERLPAMPSGVAMVGMGGDATGAPRMLVHRVEAIARFSPRRRTWLAGVCTLLTVGLLGLTDHERLPPRRIWLFQPEAILGLLEGLPDAPTG